MTHEDFTTLFTDEQMEHLEHAGITLEVLEAYWDELVRQKGVRLSRIPKEKVRNQILEWGERELTHIFRKRRCSSVRN